MERTAKLENSPESAKRSGSGAQADKGRRGSERGAKYVLKVEYVKSDGERARSGRLQSVGCKSTGRGSAGAFPKGWRPRTPPRAKREARGKRNPPRLPYPTRPRQNTPPNRMGEISAGGAPTARTRGREPRHTRTRARTDARGAREAEPTERDGRSTERGTGRTTTRERGRGEGVAAGARLPHETTVGRETKPPRFYRCKLSFVNGWDNGLIYTLLWLKKPDHNRKFNTVLHAPCCPASLSIIYICKHPARLSICKFYKWKEPPAGGAKQPRHTLQDTRAKPSHGTRERAHGRTHGGHAKRSQPSGTDGARSGGRGEGARGGLGAGGSVAGGSVATPAGGSQENK